MKPLLLFSLIALASCNSKPSFESAVKKYVRDSVVVKFDDPSAYKYVSMDKPDSQYKHQLYQKDLDLYAKMILDGQKDLLQQRQQLAKDAAFYQSHGLSNLDSSGLKSSEAIISGYKEIVQRDRKILDEPDSVVFVMVGVNLKAKNKAGAESLSKVRLEYDVNHNTFRAVDKQN